MLDGSETDAGLIAYRQMITDFIPIRRGFTLAQARNAIVSLEADLIEDVQPDSAHPFVFTNEYPSEVSVYQNHLLQSYIFDPCSGLAFWLDVLSSDGQVVDKIIVRPGSFEMSVGFSFEIP